MPGEHDVLDDSGQPYLERFGKGTQGDGWYSFDQKGVHFVGLVNVVDLKAGGLGTLGPRQLEWLEKDLERLLEQHAGYRVRSHSTLDGLSRVGVGHGG